MHSLPKFSQRTPDHTLMQNEPPDAELAAHPLRTHAVPLFRYADERT